MRKEGIPFKDTGFFSGLINDYLEASPGLEPFYGRYPGLPSFREQLLEKLDAYPEDHRRILCDVLEEQYRGMELSKATRGHLGALADSATVTVVTGHQLNLFTGPLYFHYKIASTIALCRQLQAAYPDHIFVPVYWMATEDHDFEEINHFNFKGKEFRWNRESGGPVGRMATDGLEELAGQFAQDLGPGQYARELRELFESAYLEQPSLAAATRFLVNRLFGREGLVILDADDPRLKALFVPQMEKDLFEGLAHRCVSGTTQQLQAVKDAYPVQVNPREINLFYMEDGLRERIVEEEGTYGVLGTNLRFSREELEEELHTHPGRFSPNVITRPLYQEVILPNIGYIGGGGEIAYWLELRAYFKAAGIPFPILMLRNSALLLSEKQADKAAKLGVTLPELFLEEHELINRKIRQISDIDIDFSPQREHLKKQFRDLYGLAEKTDPSFLGAVKAQEVKQLKGLDHLEKRLLKAQKRKLRDHVNRLTALKGALFPNGNLQERTRNFSDFYMELGNRWVPSLLDAFEPLEPDFTVLIYRP
ncbi:bacillithiol biosynthesis cysteine-adding enzyme BshC [Robiginitalea sp. SC105]|uniref:bacillithiol biosynthesis cysteine-adding enzyme BshC n=1 Tax=Robiginitalea sp. SC105 TaxID=2762332 RepID=UPI00163A4C92|nr:bacillithiol biosynthesis cysteine-adding enzyme BshC [Robiginitalea sp. SC105]MBC2840156.1 bacillithiol biosynthesis cysteine-adding enzyme BshC [Robiginitalea sp. SC105]